MRLIPPLPWDPVLTGPDEPPRIRRVAIVDDESRPLRWPARFQIAALGRKVAPPVALLDDGFAAEQFPVPA